MAVPQFIAQELNYDYELDYCDFFPEPKLK